MLVYVEYLSDFRSELLTFKYNLEGLLGVLLIHFKRETAARQSEEPANHIRRQDVY